jgi:hypothetical protein
MLIIWLFQWMQLLRKVVLIVIRIVLVDWIFLIGIVRGGWAGIAQSV